MKFQPPRHNSLASAFQTGELAQKKELIMSWMIKISSTGFTEGMNPGTAPVDRFSVMSTSTHVVVRWRMSPNAGKTASWTTTAGQAEQVWQNVLSALVGI
jgi:hypothetical protein